MEKFNFNKEEKDLQVEKLIESIAKEHQEELNETQEIDEESIKLEVQANLDNVRKNLNSISAETDDQHISELDRSLLEKKVEKLTKRSISYLKDIFDMDSKNKTDKKSAYKTVVNTLKNTFRENGDKTNLIDDIIGGLDVVKGNHKKIIAELFEKVLDSKISLEGLGYIGDIDMNFETDEYIDGDVFEQRLKLSQKNLLNDNEYNAKTGEYDAISQISDKIVGIEKRLLVGGWTNN